MPDARHVRLADLLVGYSTSVKPGELVFIDSSPAAGPLLQALYRRVLEAGGHPHVHVVPDGAAESLLLHGGDDQLTWVNPVRREELERADVRIAVEAETNRRALTGVDPSRLSLVARSRNEMRDIYFRRSASGELRSVITLYPTPATAQDAEMSLADYEDFVYRAGLLDHDDPVAAWRELGARMRAVAERLAEKRELRVVAEGTDLTVGTEGRTWIPCDGTENFPDGEVFTAPVEASLEGTIRFSYPATFSGRVVRDIELRFESGEVVESHASQGEELLREMLQLDDGARRAGEFSFGMNDAVEEFTGHTLFDEKIGGTVHLALGKAYPESGGVNDSALHWDLVCDLRSGSEVYADGELVYRDGQFLEGAV